MGAGLKITSILGGNWRKTNGTELVVTEPDTEIEWPMGEAVEVPHGTTSLENLGFASHFSDNPTARTNFEEGLKDRELALRPSRGVSALTHDGGM